MMLVGEIKVKILVLLISSLPERCGDYGECRPPSLRGALLMRSTLAVRRVSGVLHARILCNRARGQLQ